jgi:3-hydroxymyristoyl/3-hydroxydecanoyl-(acyl carrier protein) dehydratase
MRSLFIDRILEIGAHGGGTIPINKAFPRSKEYVDGAFRGRNEVPSSLILETMATAGSSLRTVKSGDQAQALLLKVNRAVFRRPIQAGDCVVVRSRLAGIQRDWAQADAPTDSFPLAEVHAQAFVGAEPVADAALVFVCPPLALTLGPGQEEALAGILELLGYTESRP